MRPLSRYVTKSLKLLLFWEVILTINKDTRMSKTRWINVHNFRRLCPEVCQRRSARRTDKPPVQQKRFLRAREWQWWVDVEWILRGRNWNDGTMTIPQGWGQPIPNHVLFPISYNKTFFKLVSHFWFEELSNTLSLSISLTLGSNGWRQLYPPVGKRVTICHTNCPWLDRHSASEKLRDIERLINILLLFFLLFYFFFAKLLL